MSQITTHILDTALGKPAAGVPVRLEKQKSENEWTSMAGGTTDSDGRVGNLLPDTTVLAPGTYRMYFDTQSYFAKTKTAAFYPFVTVVFAVTDDSHYHVPLLLNPFGYSTYRGS
ncbi:MAG: hydroxyisourate hydrolase [Bacteroidota bacterium]